MVFGGVQDLERRVNLVGVGQRRLLPHLCQVCPGGGFRFPFDHLRTEVGCAIATDLVRDRSLGHGGLEAIGGLGF